MLTLRRLSVFKNSGAVHTCECGCECECDTFSFTFTLATSGTLENNTCSAAQAMHRNRVYLVQAGP